MPRISDADTSHNEGLFIGLISGTSADAIDAALVRVTAQGCQMIAQHTPPYDDALHDAVVALCNPGADEITRLGALDQRLGHDFANAALALIEQAGFSPEDITAIGSHGQTVRHMPELACTLQIGNADVIATRTGITTISDFRSRDMALGGQGAPLVPRFHQACLSRPGMRRAVLNLGGIANVTLLEGETLIGGFDTGPASVLMDYWCRKHTGERFDRDGAWAQRGQVIPALLDHCLRTPYLALPAPKSTGRELFNGPWLEAQLTQCPAAADAAPEDVQATLLQFTARTIADALQSFAPSELLVCGGGAANGHLMTALGIELPGANVSTTSDHGVPADMVEACAFAWLAWAHLNGVPGNAPQVTGASRDAVLGALYPA
ncbi:anhydro-N-acetylmuramic acid kinase [Alcanivorax limicola]|uniref:anhydro-N-acetylmuramic acid kinase n=1 Tax=Alcanivorax limicola TaxID=2874102 RepID=UPI001CBCDCDA|nr:anhydro-N-acetylmuramic acid kinase [Alcanivorax limicola]